MSCDIIMGPIKNNNSNEYVRSSSQIVKVTYQTDGPATHYLPFSTVRHKNISIIYLPDLLYIDVVSIFSTISTLRQSNLSAQFSIDKAEKDQLLNGGTELRKR